MTQLSEYREFQIKALLDCYVKYLWKLSSEDMDTMIKAKCYLYRDAIKEEVKHENQGKDKDKTTEDKQAGEGSSPSIS